MEFYFLVENQQNDSEVTLVSPLRGGEIQRLLDNEAMSLSYWEVLIPKQCLSSSFRSKNKGPQASVLSFSSDTGQISSSVVWFLVSLEAERVLSLSTKLLGVCRQCIFSGPHEAPGWLHELASCSLCCAPLYIICVFNAHSCSCPC